MPEPLRPREGAWYLAPGLVVGAVAFVWFMTLSSLLGVKPGAPVAERPDVFFNADTSRAIARLTNPKLPYSTAHRYFAHSFELLVWRPIARTVVLGLEAITSPDRARVLAARLLVATLAAAGVACLTSFALTIGLHAMPAFALVVVYLLFTANLLVAVPENFGISSGLLMMAFWLWSVVPQSPRKTVGLIMVGIAAAGTTITNGLLVAVCMAHDRSRSAARTSIIAVAMLAGLTALTLALTRVSPAVNYYTYAFMNGRLRHDKSAAVLYAISSAVYPVIGPKPYVKAIDGATMVSYEPVDAREYSWLQAIGAVTWLSLLVAAGARAILDERTKPYAIVLMLWVLFNALLHNVWGDEFFLYSPHWAWALMAVVMLGVRRARPGWVVAAALAIIPGQLQAISQIREALVTITR